MFSSISGKLQNAKLKWQDARRDAKADRDQKRAIKKHARSEQHRVACVTEGVEAIRKQPVLVEHKLKQATQSALRGLHEAGPSYGIRFAGTREEAVGGIDTSLSAGDKVTIGCQALHAAPNITKAAYHLWRTAENHEQSRELEKDVHNVRVQQALERDRHMTREKGQKFYDAFDSFEEAEQAFDNYEQTGWLFGEEDD